MAELVDARDLKSLSLGYAGSIPAVRTMSSGADVELPPAEYFMASASATVKVPTRAVSYFVSLKSSNGDGAGSADFDALRDGVLFAGFLLTSFVAASCRATDGAALAGAGFAVAGAAFSVNLIAI